MLDPLLGSSTRADTEPEDMALRLLQPDALVPPRYYQVRDQLREWGLPGDLVQLGLVMRRVEQGSIAPVQLAPLLGDAAAEVAAALAAFGGAPRPALRAIEPAWKLFTLAYLNPSAAVLKIAELLMHLRHSQDADIAIGDETFGAAAGVCGRLGMWDVRAELLDARARLADPHLAQHARALLDTSLQAREIDWGAGAALAPWGSNPMQQQTISARNQRIASSSGHSRDRIALIKS